MSNSEKSVQPVGMLGTNLNSVTAVGLVNLASHIWELDSKKGIHAFCSVYGKQNWISKMTLKLQAELVTMDDFDGLGITKLEISAVPSGERWK